MRTGQILDFYDDVEGQGLAGIPAELISDFVKEAQYLDEATRNKLPDDVYALVMLDNGKVMRKYACNDSGNTALSVIYFLENKDKLPEEAQKVAAANLVTACGWYGLEPPDELLKIAASELKRRKTKVKVSDLVGSNVMPLSGPEKLSAGMFGNPDDSFQNPGREEMNPSTVFDPYADVSNKTASVKYVQDEVEHWGICKTGEARFPLDSYDEVEQAVSWFNNYYQSLHPEERREFAVNIVNRADELAIPVSPLIEKYASSEYAPDGDIRVAVAMRMQHWADGSPERGLLQELLDKYASMHPDSFCEALRIFDESTGLNREWDSTIYDPWFSTYGVEKRGEWVFEHAGERLTSDQLRQLVSGQKYEKLEELFGEELAKELKKKPEAIFDSLPLDTKLIIARMAADKQP
jgi:hypothetical protein